VDRELLRAMKRAGCVRVSMGVESGSSRQLAQMRKGITLAQVRDAFAWAKAAGLLTLADFMLWCPGETHQERQETLRFAQTLRADYVQFSLTVPYPSTPMYLQAQQQGVVQGDPWQEYALNPREDFLCPLWDSRTPRSAQYELLRRVYRRYYRAPTFIAREVAGVRSLKEARVKAAAFAQLFK
jgi:radical SAM superfamily enzyme YgiQ (UPF0313 family)